MDLFFWNWQTFLLEAKWVKDLVPASSLYSFKGKLDGKFHATSGIFLSYNGYSKGIEDVLKFGKTLNIILFNKDDIELIYMKGVSFLEALSFKLREAGDTGSLLVPYSISSKAEALTGVPSKRVERPQINAIGITAMNTGRFGMRCY